nr:hypothetical protein Itr_chr12CG15180 [Ipomoea trifida]
MDHSTPSKYRDSTTKQIKKGTRARCPKNLLRSLLPKVIAANQNLCRQTPNRQEQNRLYWKIAQAIDSAIARAEQHRRTERSPAYWKFYGAFNNIIGSEYAEISEILGLLI